MNEQHVEIDAIARLAELGIPSRLGSELPEAGLQPHAGLIGPLLRDALSKLNPEIDHDAIENLRKFAELRDYLLPRLLSGTVRVREAEAMTEGVL